MASSDTEIQGDKYRSYIYGEGEKDTVWRNGVPNYDAVNKLFEEGRTYVWPEGSTEERVQRLVKTWEMELVHKVRPQDYKSLNAETFTISVNGRPGKKLEEVLQIGGYNNFLQTSLPENLRAYDPSRYTLQEANTVFLNVFPQGFAIEILEVYSAAVPKITYKFRHWSFMDGPFQGHAATGDLVEFFGIGIFTIDESWKIEKVEFFFDGNELVAQLLKGPIIDESEASKVGCGSGEASKCPFLNKA
ncbi:hypothetical protein ACHQM5_016453 [Ranunculus cassubicifolius]